MKLIDKAAVAAEIENCYNECLKRAKIVDADYWNAKADAYRNVLTILTASLEVEEVDLEKEVINWWNAHYSSKAYTFEGYTGHYIENSTLIEIAKHFFELGIKSKGE